MKTKFTILTILAIATSITAIAQTPKNYHIKFADTVNIYNNKTVIAIKNTKGGWKYIVVRPKDKWHVDSANVVNQY